MDPRAGDVVTVSHKASEQYPYPFRYKVLRRHDWPTDPGYAWFDGYQLDESGAVVARRPVRVRPAGILPGDVDLRSLHLPPQ